MARQRVSAVDLRSVVEWTVATLAEASSGDWSALAGDLQWDCHATAVHIADCLVSYSLQIVAGSSDGWVPFEFGMESDASPSDVLEVVRSTGKLLAAAVEVTPRSNRAWHPYGVSDAEGFAAMGVTEVLVHGADVAAGLGIGFDPPDKDVVARVATRLFPDAPDHPDAWELLLWATGRTALPAHPRRTSWKWRCEPVA